MNIGETRGARPGDSITRESRWNPEAQVPRMVWHQNGLVFQLVTWNYVSATLGQEERDDFIAIAEAIITQVDANREPDQGG